MINIKNTQRTIPLDKAVLKATAQKILDILGYSDYDLGIWFTTDKTIRKFNKEYRHKNSATDILSFAYHSDLEAGERITPESDDDKNLGDLIISPLYVKAQLHADRGSQMDTTLDQRLTVLLVHGVCHLLGYDHETDEDYAVMDKLEREILSKLV